MKGEYGELFSLPKESEKITFQHALWYIPQYTYQLLLCLQVFDAEKFTRRL